MPGLIAKSPILALILLGPLFAEEAPRPEIPKKDFAGWSACKVLRTVDGNSVVVRIDEKETSIRLDGVRTPRPADPKEPDHEHSLQASQFLKNLVQGEEVWVEYESNPPAVTAEGFTLANLYRVPDGLFVNLEVIRQGYGFTREKSEFKEKDLFRFYEKASRVAKRGLWGLDVPPLEAPAEPAPDFKGLVGSWGGSMGGVELSAGIKLDEMHVDITLGADDTWTSTIKMHFTVAAGGGLKVVVDVQQPGGRIDGEVIRFAKTPWHRIVTKTGQKDDLEGNELVLRLAPDGRLDGKFLGDDGWPFQLVRKPK